MDSRRQIESITSDLTSSIMSELSHCSHISQERLLKDPTVPGNRNSNVNSFIMCFDTDSINTATEINVAEEDNYNYQHHISFIDNENGNNHHHDHHQQQQSNKFESHFTFPPIAQMEEF